MLWSLVAKFNNYDYDEIGEVDNKILRDGKIDYSKYIVSFAIASFSFLPNTLALAKQTERERRSV